MNADTIVLTATVLGLFLNAIAVLGIAWKGGTILGRLDTTMSNLSTEVSILREQVPLLVRVAVIVEDLEDRVRRLEGRSRDAR